MKLRKRRTNGLLRLTQRWVNPWGVFDEISPFTPLSASFDDTTRLARIIGAYVSLKNGIPTAEAKPQQPRRHQIEDSHNFEIEGRTCNDDEDPFNTNSLCDKSTRNGSHNRTCIQIRVQVTDVKWIL